MLQGIGCGAVGEAVGEVCFNTAMTGYQEILTDPSYMAQIVAFTFPHIGNVGTNAEDLEQISGAADDGGARRDLPRRADRAGQLARRQRPRRLAEAARRRRPLPASTPAR